MKIRWKYPELMATIQETDRLIRQEGFEPTPPRKTMKEIFPDPIRRLNAYGPPVPGTVIRASYVETLHEAIEKQQQQLAKMQPHEVFACGSEKPCPFCVWGVHQ